MTEIYLVRHGETESNAQRRFLGSTDLPLNQRGIEQASYLRGRFAGVRPCEIYSSPYSRALMTARLLRGEDESVGITVEPELREICCGVWEGHTGEEIEQITPGMLPLWRNAPCELHIPGGETFAEVQRRAWAAFCRIAGERRGCVSVITSHMLAIQVIMAKLSGVELCDFWTMPPLPNTAVCHVVSDGGGWRVLLWGDVSHLPEELRYAPAPVAGL